MLRVAEENDNGKNYFAKNSYIILKQVTQKNWWYQPKSTQEDNLRKQPKKIILWKFASPF